MRLSLFQMALLGLAGTVACSSDAPAPTSPSSPSATLAPLSVFLTDDPFPFDSVSRVDLYVTRIDAKTADADSAQAEAVDHDAGADSAGAIHNGWVTIAAPKKTVNVLALQNGLTVDFGTVIVPKGTYKAVRFVVNNDSSSVTLNGGQVLTGKSTPSIHFHTGGEHGILAVLEQPLVVDNASTGAKLVLDFDLAHSFHIHGNSISKGGLDFEPHVRGHDRDHSGALIGMVVADSAPGTPMSQVMVEVLKLSAKSEAHRDSRPDDVVASAKTDAQGHYKVGFVHEGNYLVRAIPSLESHHGSAISANAIVVAVNATATVPTLIAPKDTVTHYEAHKP